MGQDFYEQTETGRKVFDTASEILGFSMPELCFEKNDRLDITEYTQPAMVTASLAMMKVLMEQTGIQPDAAAGLSLGEYPAMAAAGVMSAEDAIRTVRERGILMQEAVPAGIGAMAAVLAMDAEEIEKVIAPIEGVQIANYNCPGQIVISGKKEAVDEAAEKLKEAGAKRVIPLNVSGPFHSIMLTEAGEKLGKVLDTVEIHKPAIPYAANVTAAKRVIPLNVSGPFHSIMLTEAGEKLGKVLDTVEIHKPAIPYAANVTAAYVTEAEDVKPLLERQVSSSVRWEQTMRMMLADGVDTFIEIGPGKTLARDRCLPPCAGSRL